MNNGLETRLRHSWSDGGLVISHFDDFVNGEWHAEWFRLSPYGQESAYPIRATELPGLYGGNHYDGWVSVTQIVQEFDQWMQEIDDMVELSLDSKRAALQSIQTLKLFYTIACGDGLVSHCFPLRQKLVFFTQLYLEDYKKHSAQLTGGDDNEVFQTYQ